MGLQLLILYGSETWVMNPHIARVLSGFHHRVACAGATEDHADTSWEHLPAEQRSAAKANVNISTWKNSFQL